MFQYECRTVLCGEYEYSSTSENVLYCSAVKSPKYVRQSNDRGKQTINIPDIVCFRTATMHSTVAYN